MQILSDPWVVVMVLGVALMAYTAKRAIREYRTNRAQQRASAPLVVVIPKPNAYGPMLGIEFTVEIPDFIG